MPQNVSIRFIDNDGTPASEVIQFANNHTLAQITGFLDATIQNLDDSIDPQITSVKIELEYALPVGLKTEPNAGRAVARGALLGYRSVAGAPVAVYVPGTKDAFLVGGGVSLSGTLAAFADSITNGVDVGGTVIRLVDRSNSPVTAFRRAKISDRKKV